MSKIFISILWITLIGSIGFAQETSNLATISLIATDKSNNLITDLSKNEISLLINGKPQMISSLEKQELPLIYALAVDSSASMRFIFSNSLSSAKSIVNQNQSDDETMLLSFVSSDKIRTTQNFSSDKNFLTETIDSFAIESGQTAVIDTIYTAVKKVAQHKKDDGKNYRRAVFVITDGEDRDSYYTEKQLLELIQNENVQVFFISLANELDSQAGLITKSPKDKATDFMKKIAEENGGVVFTPKDIKDLPDITNRILPLVRTRYLISYSPLNDTKNKSQKIGVKSAKDSKRKDVKFYFRSNKIDK